MEAGLGQCIAQMAAARLFNEKAGHSAVPMFGCVTTGEVWQFLQLRDSQVLLDERRYYLDDIGGILAAIQTIVAQDLALLET